MKIHQPTESNIMDIAIEMVNKYETTVCELDTPEIKNAAMKVAYYSAMLDASLDDPMDDEKDQEEMISLFKARLLEHTETFQTLINAAI